LVIYPYFFSFFFFLLVFLLFLGFLLGPTPPPREFICVRTIKLQLVTVTRSHLARNSVGKLVAASADYLMRSKMLT